MKAIVVKNSKLPKLLSWFINARAITLFPFIFIKDDGDDRLINHESRLTCLHIGRWALNQCHLLDCLTNDSRDGIQTQ